MPYQRFVAWLDSGAPRRRILEGRLERLHVPTPLRSNPRPPRIVEAESRATTETSWSAWSGSDRRLASARPRRAVTLSASSRRLALLLAHYSDSTNVVFGAAFSGRPAELEGIETLVGPCVNNLPVRSTLTRISQVSMACRAAAARNTSIAQHQYAPLAQIQHWAAVPWRHRLFDSLLVFQNYAGRRSVDSARRRIRVDLLAAPEATNYPLTLRCLAAVRLAPILRVDLSGPPAGAMLD